MPYPSSGRGVSVETLCFWVIPVPRGRQTRSVSSGVRPTPHFDRTTNDSVVTGGLESRRPVRNDTVREPDVRNDVDPVGFPPAPGRDHGVSSLLRRL